MKNMVRFYNIIVLSFLFISCQGADTGSLANQSVQIPPDAKVDTMTVAGGCFWCIEGAFEQIIGVYEAVSGYSGGTASEASYKIVSYGNTDHAEAVQVYFDPDQISYDQLLDIFFVAHDPTQLNRQGPDVGRQYRSAIFYHDEEQKQMAEAKIRSLKPQFSKSIVTEINPLTDFYVAEEYHQDYERNNPFQPYILNVSKPKIDRVKLKYEDLIKNEYKE